MSGWPAVRRQIAKIVTETTTDDDSAAIFGAFRESESGIEGSDNPLSRDFDLTPESGSARNMGSFAAKGRVNMSIGLHVLYVGDVEDQVRLLDIIVSDAENIISQLADDSTWDRATSGIELIGERNGGLSAFGFEIIPLDDKMKILYISLSVLYSRGRETN